MEIPFKNYYRSKLNIIKIMNYRGYNVDEHLASLGTYENFRDKYNKFLTVGDDIIKFKKELSEDMIFSSKSIENLPEIRTIARWHTEAKLGVEISKIINEMKEHRAKKCIIIIDEGITAICKDIIRHLRVVENISITTWILKESLIFAPEHFLVPKHSIADINTKNIIIKHYGSKIPTIPKNDVMVKYLDANKGDFIEILRPSDTAPDKFIPMYRKVC